MPRLPRIEGLKLVKAMQKDEWYTARIRGSHYIMQKTFETGGDNYDSRARASWQDTENRSTECHSKEGRDESREIS